MSRYQKIMSSPYNNRRARRHYRRMVIGQPTEQEQEQLRFMPERKTTRNDRQPSATDTRPDGFVWVVALLAITVFTFICLLSGVMLAQGIVR